MREYLARGISPQEVSSLKGGVFTDAPSGYLAADPAVSQSKAIGEVAHQRAHEAAMAGLAHLIQGGGFELGEHHIAHALNRRLARQVACGDVAHFAEKLPGAYDVKQTAGLGDFDVALGQKVHALAGVVLAHDHTARAQAHPAAGLHQLPYFRVGKRGQHAHPLE